MEWGLAQAQTHFYCSADPTRRRRLARSCSPFGSGGRSWEQIQEIEPPMRSKPSGALLCLSPAQPRVRLRNLLSNEKKGADGGTVRGSQLETETSLGDALGTMSAGCVNVAPLNTEERPQLSDCPTRDFVALPVCQEPRIRAVI